MIAALLASPIAVRIMRYGAIALTVVAALLYMLGAARRSGRLVEKLEQRENTIHAARARASTDTWAAAAADDDLDDQLRAPARRRR